MGVDFGTIINMIPKIVTNVHGTEKTVSVQTGKLITLRLVVFSLCSFTVVPLAQMFYRCF